MTNPIPLPVRLPNIHYVDPKTLRCPTCNAAPGDGCKRRSKTGLLRPIKSPHPARLGLAADLRADRMDERRIEHGE